MRCRVREYLARFVPVGVLERSQNKPRRLQLRWQDWRMPLTLRPPTPADASELAALHVSTWREAYSHLLPDDFFTDQYIEGRRKMWNHILNNPREEWAIRVAENHDSIIGFAWAGVSIGADGEEMPRDRQLFAIYVAADHYGTGAGQALLEETLGDSRAMLWVAKDNPRAVAFYFRNGFTFDGVEQNDPGAPKITDARMVR